MCMCVLNKMSDIIRALQKMSLHSCESQYTADRNGTSAGELTGAEPTRSVSPKGADQNKK